MSTLTSTDATLQLPWVLIVAGCVITIGVSLLAGHCISYRDYRSRIAKAKYPGERPDITIPPEVAALIGRFDPNIKIKIANDPNLRPRAAVFHSKPAYIILSKRFLGQDTNEAIQFSTNEVLAIVAHELGHIVPEDHTTWLMEMLLGGLLGGFALICGTATLWLLWSGSLYSLLACASLIVWILACAFLIVWFGHVSCAGEYDADAFAITAAKIPIADLEHSLNKLDLYFAEKRRARTTRLRFLADSLCHSYTHPSVEQRILRIRTLYGE
jgi:Zn-dependent protease with chaperone function